MLLVFKIVAIIIVIALSSAVSNVIDENLGIHLSELGVEEWRVVAHTTLHILWGVVIGIVIMHRL